MVSEMARIIEKYRYALLLPIDFESQEPNQKDIEEYWNVAVIDESSKTISELTTSVKPESTEGGRRVSVLKRQEGAPVLLG